MSDSVHYKMLVRRERIAAHSNFSILNVLQTNTAQRIAILIVYKGLNSSNLLTHLK